MLWVFFIMEFMIGIVTFVYNFAIVHYGFGELGLAAYLVIGYLMLIILTLFLGMAEGLQPVFSYFMGTGEEERSRNMRVFATYVFLGVGIVCYLLIFFFSSYFFAIFNPGDVELIAFMENKSLLYFSGFFLAAYNILMISFWQSTGRTKNALTVSLCRSLIFPPILSCVGIWTGKQSGLYAVGRNTNNTLLCYSEFSKTKMSKLIMALMTYLFVLGY